MPRGGLVPGKSPLCKIEHRIKHMHTPWKSLLVSIFFRSGWKEFSLSYTDRSTNVHTYRLYLILSFLYPSEIFRNAAQFGSLWQFIHRDRTRTVAFPPQTPSIHPSSLFLVRHILSAAIKRATPTHGRSCFKPCDTLKGDDDRIVSRSSPTSLVWFSFSFLLFFFSTHTWTKEAGTHLPPFYNSFRGQIIFYIPLLRLRLLPSLFPLQR